MTFRTAVEATAHLNGAYCAGLQALSGDNRNRVSAEDTRALTGSVDIDAALSKVAPHDARWDFAIAYQHTNRTSEVIYFLEIHSGSEVTAVIKKVQWLMGWLGKEGRGMAGFERDIVWISSGAISFTLSAPQRKQMAQSGLRHGGRVLRITEARR